MEVDRAVSSALAAILGLLLASLSALVSYTLWYEAGGKNSGGIIAIVVGCAVFVLTVWKAGGMLRNVQRATLSRLPEPLRSSVEFSFSGALLFGGVMVVGILLLGHTRPVGWEFDRVLPSMAWGAAIFLVVGLVVGLSRSQGNP
jgi:hypothetical protein